MERVSVFKFLWVYISETLVWSGNVQEIKKKIPATFIFSSTSQKEWSRVKGIRYFVSPFNIVCFVVLYFSMVPKLHCRGQERSSASNFYSTEKSVVDFCPRQKFMIPAVLEEQRK